jgi:hypothetical protein
MGKVRNAYNILVRKPERKISYKDLGIDGRIRLEWILGNRIGTGGRLF